MPTINLRDPVVHLLNPCPTVSTEEVHRRAKLLQGGSGHSSHDDFGIKVTWSSGSEGESVEVASGSDLQLPSKVARQLEKHFGHRGLVIIENHRSRRDAMISGIVKAIGFFRTRGAQSILSIQAQRGWGEDQVEKMRDGELRSQFVNVAREEILREYLEEIQTAPSYDPVDVVAGGGGGVLSTGSAPPQG